MSDMDHEFKTFLSKRGITEEKYASMNDEVQFKWAELYEKRKPETTKLMTLEELLHVGLGQPPDHEVVSAMRIYYVSKIAGIVSAQDTTIALHYYHEASLRPSTTTVQRLQQHHGVIISNQVSTFGGNIFLASKHSTPLIVKRIISDAEIDRLVGLVGHAAIQHKYIISFVVLDRQAMSLLISMPRLIATVSTLHRPVDYSGLSIIISCVLEALDHLHFHQYGHNDIKDTNIGLDHNGRAILIDLDSVVEFGGRSDSTESFIPSDMKTESPPYERGTMVARRDVDIWMLAVTAYYLLRDGPMPRTAPTKQACVNFLRGLGDPREEMLKAVRPLLERLGPTADTA